MNNMKKNLVKWMPAALFLLTTGCNVYEGENDGGSQYTNFSLNGNEDFTDPISHGQGDKFDDFTDNLFIQVATQPTSTFSVDADGASYAIMRRYVSNGYTVSPSSVRIEEFLNYFTFDYPSPTNGQAIAINSEVNVCPWNQDHYLVRLGLKGKELTENEVPQANFVFLIDVSGSMNGSDRLDLLKSGLKELLFRLNPNDRISIVTYSGTVQKLLESTPVKESSVIQDAIDKLYASGCTAGGEALKMAYEEALANYNPAYNNRVIMGTDGDFNVGVTNTEALVEMVESYAVKGIYMTCLGFGMGNFNDGMMEKISNSGNGNYYYIDCEDEMMKVFVHERERFVSVANDTKCQITFDSTLIKSYRLIGYENRVMNNDDFDNDKKDAGEIGAGQTITALYEIEPTEGFRNTVNNNQSFATFDVRYKKVLGDKSIPLSTNLTVKDINNTATANFHFAAGVAAYGMVLRSSPHKGTSTIDLAKELVGKSLSFDPHGYRAELLKLMDRAVIKE